MGLGRFALHANERQSESLDRNVVGTLVVLVSTAIGL